MTLEPEFTVSGLNKFDSNYLCIVANNIFHYVESTITRERHTQKVSENVHIVTLFMLFNCNVRLVCSFVCLVWEQKEVKIYTIKYTQLCTDKIPFLLHYFTWNTPYWTTPSQYIYLFAFKLINTERGRRCGQRKSYNSTGKCFLIIFMLNICVLVVVNKVG